MRSQVDGSPDLARAFRTALSVAGIGALELLGCENGTPKPPAAAAVDEPRFFPVTCTVRSTGKPEPALLAEIKPASPVDYMELSFWLGGGTSLEQHGKACSSALDAAACMTRLETAKAPWEAKQLDLITRGAGELPSRCVLRATRGDEVLHITATSKLREFLAPVDSLAEAELLSICHNASVAGEAPGEPPFLFRPELVCGRSGGTPREKGFDVVVFTRPGCDGVSRHVVHVDTSGQLSLRESIVEKAPDPNCVVGRRPEGFVARTEAGPHLGTFLAHSAELEAASVPAFLRLARELEAHGAPRSLALRAMGAARDEVRHAVSVARLARAWGARPQFSHVPAGSVRPLERIALENAVEGCVYETYGALVAQHQAVRARSRGIAVAYAAIARDEARHAALSWDVARWLEPRLSRSARRHVHDARRRAALALQSSLARAKARPMDDVAGLPPPALGHSLARALDAELWRAA